MKTKKNKIYLLFLCVLFCSCEKYLDQIPDKSLATPSNLADFWAILDHDDMANGGQGATPALNNMGTDEYVFSYSDWQAQPKIVRNAHIWQKNTYEGEIVPDWGLTYTNIYRTNIVLNGLENVETNVSNINEYQQIKGSALFLRAFYNYWLQETFGQPYKKNSAATDLGIPLRLDSDLETKIRRATVEETYQQILIDLSVAKDLVPVNMQMDQRNRPSKVAVYALMARTYLTMQEYEQAGKYADSCLTLYSTLVDYNTVSTTPTYPFLYTGNDEVIFQCAAYSGYLFPWGASVNINPALYNSYDNDDIRKLAFFRKNTAQGTISFKGNYTGTFASFSGLATDECYLIKAETMARSNDTAGALNLLNSLLEKRYTSGTFKPLSAQNPTQALNLVLYERKKELLFRGLRWIDLRRLNQEEDHAITITRTLSNETYTLLPGSLSYAYPIPDSEVLLSGIEQNTY